MTEPQTEQITDPPKAKSPRKRAKRRAVSKAEKKDSPFAGMTVNRCPTACNAEKCIISARPVCAHPNLGGLQTSINDPDAQARLKAAKRFLGEQKLDLTHG